MKCQIFLRVCNLLVQVRWTYGRSRRPDAPAQAGLVRTARVACAMGHARAARSRPHAALSAASSSIVPTVSLILYRVLF